MRLQNFLNEGGKSGNVRYNTELSCLMAYTGTNKNLSDFDPTRSDFDPSEWWDRSKLHQPDRVYKEIMSFLPNNYDESEFKSYYNISMKMKPFVERKVGKIGQLFWVGGTNATGDDSNPADVEFFGSKAYGISVKGKGGITLSNLSPSRIGLESTGDAIKFYCDKVDPTLYMNWKKTVVLSALKKAQQLKGKPYTPDTKSSYYNISHVDGDIYTIGSKVTTNNYKENQILMSLDRNLEWHSVFGAHLTKNVSEFSSITSKVFSVAAQAITPIIQDAFVDHVKIQKVLNFADLPYFYQSMKSLYYIPSKSELSQKVIEVKGIDYTINDKKASGILMKVKIGTKGSSDYSVIDLWLRYANRVFGSNSTVRVQELKNPEHIAWEKLV